jgi:hypothetical protein
VDDDRCIIFVLQIITIPLIVRDLHAAAHFSGTHLKIQLN